MLCRVGRLVGAALFSGLALTAALAGDAATPTIIGFSRDGRYFAFEEFGTHDASIHPYSTIFVIDLDTGKTVSGAPFVVQFDREAPEQEARAEVRKKAESFLIKLGIGEKPSRQVVDAAARLSDPPTPDQAYAVQAAEGQALRIGDVLPAGEIEVKIEPRPFPDRFCIEEGRKYATSFALLRALPGGKPLETVHVEGADGRERGCSGGNGLNALYAYHPPGGKPRLVALVSYWPHNWEEPDRRYLAIPVPLP